MDENPEEHGKSTVATSSTKNEPPLDIKGEALRGLVLDNRSIAGEGAVFECYCYDRRDVLEIRPNRGLCRSYEIVFSIKSRDIDGIYNVFIESVNENWPEDTNGEVVLGRDGIVRIKTYVAVSDCPRHESYGENILWSSKFQRVLRSEEKDKPKKLVIYSTYVQRDTSTMAVSNGVLFRICDLLKEVADKDLVRRLRDQMLEDQDNWSSRASRNTSASDSPVGEGSQRIADSPCTSSTNDGGPAVRDDLLAASTLMNELHIGLEDEPLIGILLDEVPRRSQIFECYCTSQRKLFKIRSTRGLCISWMITFSIESKGDDGIYNVNVNNVDTDPTETTKGEVFLGRDGVVRIKTYVCSSLCIQHESYEEIILWSDKFQRVLNNSQREKLKKLSIYSTYVQRDNSKMATAHGVAFRICELLKPLDDEQMVKQYREQMLEDQDKWYAMILSERKKHEEKKHHGPELGTKGFSDEGPYSARVYGPVPQRRNYRIRKGRDISSSLPDRLRLYPPLMLCVRVDGRGTRAWNSELGVIPVEDPFIEQTGKVLRKGDWFHGNLRLRDVDSRQFHHVKKVDRLADPPVYTYCLNNSIEIEIEGDFTLVENLPNRKVIMKHPQLGNIEITERDYNRIASQSMVCVLRFNEFNSNVPWTFVKFIRTLAHDGECSTSPNPQYLVSNLRRRAV